MSWSLRRRLAIFLAAIGLIVLAVVISAVVLFTTMRNEQKLVVDHFFSELTISNDRFVDQIDAETALRGYALTHNPVTLQPAHEIESPTYQQQYVQLTALTRGHPTSAANVTAWQTASQTWYEQYALPAIATVRSGGHLSDANVLAGKALFDANRAAYQKFHTRNISSRQSADRTLKHDTTLLFIAVIVAVAVVILAGLAMWLSLRRWVLGPLLTLGRETRIVTSGSIDHEVTAAGPQEIVALGEDVEAMRRDIATQLAQVEESRRQIEAAQVALAEQAENLARSNRDLEQFAYVASHDLQEPLRKVASFCQMLERRYSGQLDERADTYIAFAVDGAKRMQQLINDLLAFSRVGRMSEGSADVDMQAAFSTAVQNLDGAIESSGAQVTTDPLPRLPGERGLLVQLLQNLIGNAIKFHGDEAPRVHIGVSAHDAIYEFSCSDNGIGIEPQYAERIFVIFQRLHGKDEYAGTGIGLALCKRIVEHHGGQIWLDENRGVGSGAGTTFRWTLPAIARENSPAAGMLAPAQSMPETPVTKETV